MTEGAENDCKTQEEIFVERWKDLESTLVNKAEDMRRGKEKSQTAHQKDEKRIKVRTR